MENIRFLLYLASIGFFFLILTAVKFLSPEEEHLAPVDEIGMKLYRPIFFGKGEQPKKSAKIKKKIDPVFEDEFPTKSAVAELEKVKKEPVTNSIPDSEAYFVEMVSAYRANVLTKRKYRNDVVVRYYQHESDQDKAHVLVDYGFYLHVRPLHSYGYKSTDSNVIHYGKDFPERDLKLIAYLLIKNGIFIKQIQPFKDFDGWKKRSIEIGGDPKLENQPTLSFGEIRAYSIQD